MEHNVFSCGLRGSLILFAPHAFVRQRRCWARKQPSPIGLRLEITALHRFLEPSVFLSQTHECAFHRAFPRFFQGFNPMSAPPPRHPSRPVIPMVLAPFVLPRLLARSLPGLLFFSFIIGESLEVYNSALSTSFTRCRCIRVSPSVQDSSLLP